MKKWLLSAKATVFDHTQAFKDQGFIDWRQLRNYEIGDEVYIYCALPLSKIKYKTVVVDTKMKVSDIADQNKYWKIKPELYAEYTYVRLKYEKTCEDPGLAYQELKKHGMKYAPQSPCLVGSELEKYLMKFF